MTVIPFPLQPGSRATLFISEINPDYPAMLERAKTAPPVEYLHDPKHQGLWVPLKWFRQGE